MRVRHTSNVHARLSSHSFQSLPGLPLALPSILGGVRNGFTLSVTGAVVGEMVMGGSGLGTLLTLSREAADTAAVFAVVAWISLAAMTLYYLVQLAERAAVARLQGEDS